MRKLFNYPGPLWKLSAALGLTGIGISIVVWTLWILFCTYVLRFGRQRQTHLIRQWLGYVCWASGVRFLIEGAEHHDASRGALLVSNHQSLFDIPAVFAGCRGDIRMVAKKELFEIPFFGASMHACEMIPIQRESQTSSKEASAKVRDQIRSGLQIWLAPEGTRSKDGTLGKFKRGSFALAIQAGVPVQPIVVLDSRLAATKGSLLSKRGTVVHVRILPTISTEGMTTDDRGRLAELTRAAMATAMEQGVGIVEASGRFASPLHPVATGSSRV